MNPNNMTGEPNQQNINYPSVFTFDPYPPPYPVNWNQANPFTNSSPQFAHVPGLSPEACGATSFSSFQGNLIVPPQSQSSNLENSGMIPFSQPQTSYSFGSPKPTQEVVHFPFQISHGFGQRTFRCKRKTDSPPLQLAKQHITEEKMAEHMSKLHISSETASSKESESSRMQRLYMCEEMRKLQSDSIIPQSLLSKMQQPCKALVLWKPPARLIPPEANNDVDENENNNGESVPDSNAVENVMESEMENEMVVNNMDMDNC